MADDMARRRTRLLIQYRPAHFARRDFCDAATCWSPGGAQLAELKSKRQLMLFSAEMLTTGLVQRYGRRGRGENKMRRGDSRDFSGYVDDCAKTF